MWGTSYIHVQRKNNRHPELVENLIKRSVPINTRKMTDKLIKSLFVYRDLGYSVRQLSDIFPIKKSQSIILKKSPSIPSKLILAP